jgi:hypothetical protein
VSHWRCSNWKQEEREAFITKSGTISSRISDNAVRHVIEIQDKLKIGNGNAKWCSHCVKVWKFLKMLKIDF